MADLRELVDLMSEGGPAQSIMAAKKGFDEGRQKSLEERKAAFQQKLAEAGLLSGKEANTLAGQSIFNEQRSLPTEIIGSLSNMQIANKRETAVPQEKPLTAKEKADIEFKNKQLELQREGLNLRKSEVGQKRAEATGKATLQQSNDALFAGRADQAEKDLKNLFDKGFSVGLGVETNRLFPQIMKGQDVKKYDQAKRNFLNAVLRKESGATIQPSEIQEGDIQYFPQPGDGPEVLAQKAQNRAFVIAQLKRGASGQKGIAETPTAPQAAPAGDAASFIKEMEAKGFKFKGVK